MILRTLNKTLAGLSAKQIQWLGLVGACACAAVPVYAVDPEGVGFFPRCPIHALTGLYCPGCGSTRAVHQLLHGNIGASLRLNPVAFLLLPALAYSFLSFTVEAFKGRPLPRPFGNRLPLALLFGVVLPFSILRNVPFYPFTLLAPH